MENMMQAYKTWCDNPKQGTAHRDSSVRRDAYKVGYAAGRDSCHESLDSLQQDVRGIKEDYAAMHLYAMAGRDLMRELASAADGVVLAGELIPDELNERISTWLRREPLLPPNNQVERP